MGVNPFKDANLEDLQQGIISFLSNNFGFIIEILKDKWFIFLKKAKERLTIMLIPHSEKRIINFHVPIYTITLIISAVLITIIITSIAIVNHASTIKDVSKLKMHGTNSKFQILKYKTEINKLYDIFQKLKPEITSLYLLTDKKSVDSLWAKGGVSNPDIYDSSIDNISPSIEELNIKEIEQELKITRDVLEKIKIFLEKEKRKKIIDTTPSLWPSDGYIISKFGSQSSSYISDKGSSLGIEIAGFPGAAIRSTASGTVKTISWDPSLGLTISIDHGRGFMTRYSHCQRVSDKLRQKVSKGESIKVSKGEIIGYMGKTGNAIRHICYYQIKIGMDYVDPMPYLNKISQ